MLDARRSAAVADRGVTFFNTAEVYGRSAMNSRLARRCSFSATVVVIVVVTTLA
jgi:aryl-alcohol dehydrogenase-like predicted oxidoreductase